MYKIAVLGDLESVLGFKAIGFDAVSAASYDQARAHLIRLCKEDYAIIYITEGLAAQLQDEISKYSDRPMPAIVPIPGKDGTLEIGMRAVHKAVERAVGADIL